MKLTSKFQFIFTTAQALGSFLAKLANTRSKLSKYRRMVGTHFLCKEAKEEGSKRLGHRNHQGRRRSILIRERERERSSHLCPYIPLTYNMPKYLFPYPRRRKYYADSTS